MTLPTEAQRSFRLYVTHVDGEDQFLKISGQLDQQNSLMLEGLFESARENLEKDIGAIPPTAIHEGDICAAKYIDETYYRAKIINISNLADGIVEVHFIDYGIRDIVSLSTIRFLDSYDPVFLRIPGQAMDYYLSRVMHPSGRWEERRLLELQTLLCNAEYPALVEAETKTLPIISIDLKGKDLSTHLVANRSAIAVPLHMQEVLLSQMADNQLGRSWLQTMVANATPFTEHEPFIMRFKQNMVNLRATIRQPQHVPSSVPLSAPMAPPSAVTNKPRSPKKCITYKSKLLEMNSQHKVFVSFAEEGPELFAVQLLSDATKLQDMMDDINRRSYSSLAEPPMIGTSCLGRISGDDTVCRTTVMELSHSQCKLFFVDFGMTDIVSYYEIFDIPAEFVKPNVFALQFCLSGVKKLEKSPHLNEAFKQLVSGKVLTLRLVPPEGPPLIKYAELFLGNKSVLDLLMANMKDKLQFKLLEMLPLGSRQSVLVSYVESCRNFYVQLSDNIDDLKAVMGAVKIHCENTSSPGELPVGAVCCARFPDDDNWYRAMVMVSRGNKVVVAYVDYGNEQEVDVTDLRTITPDLIKLPAQAMKCALKGFENKPIETKTSDQLETLALEKTLLAQIVGVLSSDTVLVTLIDDTVIPPLDVAKKINQLSQPRSNTIEAKVTTPLRRDAPETTSSPRGSLQDDKKKNFRREKIFKEEKRRDGEDFRPKGSFRVWDNIYTQDEDSRVGDRRNRGFRPDSGDNRGDRRDKKDNWNQKRVVRDNRADRGERQDKGRSKITPLERAERADQSLASDSENRSTISFRSQDSGFNRNNSIPPQKPRAKFTQVQYKELSDPLPPETPFTEPSVEIGSQQEVSVTWVNSPENFYTQILTTQKPKFLEMMHKIPAMYKGVRSYSGNLPIGASVLVRSPADGVLYRATVLDILTFPKFLVRYVDFGNMQLVDAKDIWQMERELMELPKMAVHCSLSGVVPKSGVWKPEPEIDVCFNAPRYQCLFQQYVDDHDQYKVSLWNNGVSVADLLVEKKLAVMSESQTAVTLEDEAIDLAIIVGQQIMCRVTYVESFEKFFVQLDLDKAGLVENAVNGYDVAKLTPLTADRLMKGIHCVVKHNDKAYRAILNDVSDTNNIEAVLPDYGNTITTTIDKLLNLPTELSVYYYQSFQCSFNNYTEESKTLLSLDDLKKRLTGNKFIIYVNYVQGITLVSTLYDGVTGKKIAIFEPDEGSYDEVVPLCARAVFNSNFGNAHISHIENLNEFYLQKSSDGDKIAQLLEYLYKFYEEGTPEALTEFEADGLCVAKSCDGSWYRATILNSTENGVKVQFPDYGNSEIVPKEALKKLDPKFYEPCYLALVVSLELVSLQKDIVIKLLEWTSEKELQVTLTFGNYGWLANLHLDGVDLSMKLINEKLAATQIFPEVTPEELKSDAPIEEPISLPEGCTQVCVSHIDTPGHFWLQMLDEVQKINEIQAELQTNAESYADIENREMGTLCVAKYLADDQWYRAEILYSNSDITTIRFINYGKTDVLGNQPGLVRVMPDHLKEIERYAIKSSVNAVPTVTGQWSEPASDYFTQLVGDLSSPVDALIILKAVKTYVDIFVNSRNVTDKLVSEGHATRLEETECGDIISCLISHVNSPSEFWIQLKTAAPELQSMEAAMVDAESVPELTEKEENVLCAAKYPEDGAWYSAQVIVDGFGMEVLFMDGGNASIVNELQSLSDKLKLKPALSRKCALQKRRDIKSWSRKSEIKFNELAAEGATIFNVQFIASGDVSIQTSTEELVGLCEEHSASERPTPVGQDLYSSGKICYVNSLEEFFVHLDDSIPSLNKITDKLSVCSQFKPISDLKVGSICAAFWSEGEQWYRSRILEFCDVGYHVQFIDYGNKAKCEEVRQLPEDIAMIEPLAKCCRLAGFTGDVSYESAKSKLEGFVAELVTFQIEFLNNFKETSLVRLLLNGTDLRSVLKTDTLDLVEETEPFAKKERITHEYDNENPSEGLNSSQQGSNDNISRHNTVIMALDVEKDKDISKSTTSIDEEKNNLNKSTTSNGSNQDKVITPEKNVDNLERTNGKSIAPVKEEPKEQLNNVKDDSSEEYVVSVKETVSLDKTLVSQGDEKPVDVV